MQHAYGTFERCNFVPFNSRDSKYKTPQGGVFTRTPTKFFFPVSAKMEPSEVHLVLRRNDYSEYHPMHRGATSDGYVDFHLDLTIERDGVYMYRFEIKSGGRVYFVGRTDEGGAEIGDWLPEWQLTVSEFGFTTPDFIKGGVVYHIFCDRFCKKGEVEKPPYGVLKKWCEDVTVADADGVYRANDFFGGNFQGIISRLDYLDDLGVTVLYLSPIFLSHSNHRYDTGDYMKLDPMLGTEDDFKELIEKAAKKGMAIVLDGVFNHTGSDSIYFNKDGRFDSLGAYQSKDSPYYKWYTFYNFPDEYHCWWGITVVPTIARNADGYRELIAGHGGVIEKWTRMGVKGWRLDVVDELSDDFVKEIRSKIKREDESCIVIGEVWEDASTKHAYGEERQYFRGRELDGVMNYVFKDAIIEFMLHGNGRKFARGAGDICDNYPKICLDTCFTLIGSHDTARCINVLSGADVSLLSKEQKKNYRLTASEYKRGKKKLLGAVALQYFLPGVPSVYYGDEVGLQGFEDPINRRPFPWDGIDKEILDHYKMLGTLRKKHKKHFTGGVRITADGSEVTIEREGLTLTVSGDTGEFKISKK